MEATTKPKPIRLQHAAYGCVAVGVTLVLASTLSASNSLERLFELGARSQAASLTITHLRDVRSMSAQMYSVLGDSKWRARYEHTTVPYERAFAQLELISSEQGDAELRAVAAAERALSAIEARALELAQRGLRAEATAALDGPEYTRLFESHRRALAGLRSALDEQTDAELGAARLKLLLTMLSLIAVAAFLAWAIARLFGTVQRHLGRLQSAEAELSNLALVAREIDSGVVISGADGLIEWANPAFVGLTGYALEELVGRDPIQLFRGSETSPDAVARVQDAMKRGVTLSIELIIRHKDGHQHWVEAHLQQIVDAHTRAPKFVSIIGSISARKHAEAELTKTRNFLSSIVDHVRVGIWAKAASGPDAGRYLLWNKTLELWTGRSATEQIGRAPQELYVENFADTVQASDAQAIAQGKALEQPQNVFVMHPVLGQLELRTIRTPIVSPDGATDFLVGVVEDVTLAKRDEAALIQSKNLAEAANRAKSAFLATMSHEIRTPLNGILGMVDLMWEMKIEPELRTMLGVVRDSARILLGIISDVLDISKIEADKLTFETAEVDLQELIEGVVQLLSPLAAAKSLSLVADLSPAVASRVEVDPLRLKQVLFNLGSNAIKFTEHAKDNPGQVHIGVDLVRSGGDGLDEVRLKVQDNGIGMSQATQQLIFEPFVQADASNTRRFGGTGLGLAIVRRLCDVAGGRVSVTSREGVGSEFSVVWPVRALERTPRARVLADVKALVIAADAQLAALQARYLTEAGAQTRTLDIRNLPDNDTFGPDVVVLLDEREALGRVKLRWLETPIVGVTRDASSDTPRSLPKNFVACTGAVLPTPLIAAVLVALGKATPATRERFESLLPATTRAPSVQRAEASGRLILVVEDNDVNRDLLRRQLEFLGYASELATNGRDALERMSQRRYGLVLTDCHMPELDGFELTRIIREQEEGKPAQLPIVAITANAMAGEAERCKAAGMSDWLSKPVELNRLRATLERWLWADRGAAVPAVDPEVLAELVGGDPAYNAELFRRFVSHARELIGEIARASAEQNARGASEQAHKLKSSSASVGAGVMSHLAAQIELAGGADDHAQVADLCARLESEMQRVADEIDHILAAAEAPRRSASAV